MNNDNDNNKDFIDMREGAERGHIPPEQMPPGAGEPTGGPAEKPKPKGRFPGWAVALIFLGVGLAIGIGGFNLHFPLPFVGDVRPVRQATDRDLTSLTIPASDINNIDVRIATDNLVVNTHNGRDVRVIYNAPRSGNYNRPLYNFNERTGNLEIFTETNVIVGIGNMRSGELRIYLPETDGRLLDDLNLRTTTGRIDVNMASTGSQAANNANITSTTGNIEVSRLNAVNTEIRATTGRINLNAVEIDNNLTITTTTGNITANNLDAGNNLTVSATTGRINLDNTGARGNAEIRSTTGNINANGITASGDITASATTGRIEAQRVNTDAGLQFTTTTGNITLDGGSVSDNASFTASTGRVNLSNAEINGVLSVRTTTGNVNLTRVDADMNRADINTGRTANVNIN